MNGGSPTRRQWIPCRLIRSRRTCGIPCSREVAERILAELRTAFRDHPINPLDGVRIEFARGWALARISVTEPLITLRFEAHTDGELEAIQRQVRAASPTLKALFRASPFWPKRPVRIY